MKKLLILLVVVLLSSCEDCKHSTVDADPYAHRIDYTVGLAAMTDMATSYSIDKNGCIVYKVAIRCYSCGTVKGLKQRTVCGTYQIVY